MQKFYHIVDFAQYNVGDKFTEFLTPGNPAPGVIVQDDEGKGLNWTYAPTWLSYIRPWRDLAAPGGSATVKQRFHFTNERATNVINLMTYNTRGWGHAAVSVYNGILRVQAFANYEDQLRWANPLATVELGSWDTRDHVWVASMTKDHITVDFDGANIINVDIPAAKQGTLIDSLRVRSPYCVITAHEVHAVE